MSVIKKPDLKIFAQDAKTGEIETFPDVLRGWGVTLERTAGKPPLEWFNAIGKRVDEWLMYLTQRGLAEWDDAVDYPKDALVQQSSVFYVALKVTKGEQPNTSQNAWKPLADFLGVNNKLDKTAVVQSTGTSTTSVMSQKASTDTFVNKNDFKSELDKKITFSNHAITGGVDSAGNGSVNAADGSLRFYRNSAGVVTIFSRELPDNESNYVTSFELPKKKGIAALISDLVNFVTTSAMNVALNKKIDKASISQQLGNDVNKVPSLDLLARELGKKQPAGNYQPAGSYVTTSDFTKELDKKINYGNHTITGGVDSAGRGSVNCANGSVRLYRESDGSVTVYSREEANDTSDYHTAITLPKKKGVAVTKDELDVFLPRSEAVKNYQPKGNYGLKNTSLKSQNGWWKCGDTGIIYQWGRKDISYDDFFIDLPIAFPSSIASVSIIDYDGAKNIGINLSKSTLSKIATEMTAPNIRIMWLAVGY
ncbi:gp53-like domain-containing protein [Proteus alimentorum]|uniref:gp53-like domain-containing protein n=1 Tax=Proteus alimentorum TaxID=1973495 RepID=UPI001F0AB51A|nr:hypothetical protein [Proteus alimentorum]